MGAARTLRIEEIGAEAGVLDVTLWELIWAVSEVASSEAKVPSALWDEPHTSGDRSQTTNGVRALHVLTVPECLELFWAVSEVASSEAEVIATVSALLRSGKVRLNGNFRGCPIPLG